MSRWSIVVLVLVLVAGIVVSVAPLDGPRAEAAAQESPAAGQAETAGGMGPDPGLTAAPEAALPLAVLPDDRPFIGIYAPDGSADGPGYDIAHAFVRWDDSAAIDRAIAEARRQGRVPLITIEPWTTASGEPTAVLRDTAAMNGAGANDALIRANARAIGRHAPQLVLVRFAHEMELVGAYPWSQADPAAYIAAYQRYHDLVAAEGVANVRWVWSPAGNPEAPGYYPGDVYVDYVGLTVLGNETWDVRWGAPHGRAFSDLFAEKSARVAGFGKPVIIGELGVTARDTAGADERRAYQVAWLREAAATFDRYPNLAGIVYFNALNPPSMWIGDRPDWRLDAATILAALSLKIGSFTAVG
jgi:beta-mannanase